MNPHGLIIIAIGVLAVVGAALNWRQYLGDYKPGFVDIFFSPRGARVFYAVLGMLMIILGVLITIGVLKHSG